MKSNSMDRTGRSGTDRRAKASFAARVGIGLMASLVLAAGVAPAVAQSGSGQSGGASGAGQASGGGQAKAAQTNNDIIVFRDGRTLEGVVVSETATTIKFRGTVAGIALETDYAKSDIVEIKRGAGAAIGTGGATPAPTTGATPSATGTTAPSTMSANQPVKQGGVYWMTLEGRFAQQITQTPIRDALRDARRYRPDIIIVEVNNEVIPPSEWDDPSVARDELYAEIDELFRAEKFLPIMVSEMPSEWGYTPRVVYWVKRALGGIAFMPLTGREIYFHPDGRLGGVGNLDQYIRAGHRRVVEKQMSLRLQHAVGWVNHSGFPQPELLTRALVKESTVLSVRFEDGRPVLFEGYPSNPSEEVLTDDGQGANVDTIDLLARGQGNDVLTLDERLAKLIGLSRGTVATRDELLAAIGVSRDALIDGRSERIMSDWARGLEQAYTSLQRLAREYGEIEVAGTLQERRAARAARIQKLEQIRALANRWNEGFEPRRIAQMGLPASGDGLNIAAVQQVIDRLRLEQSLDRG
jgi:sulfur carrier protein ThiS